MPKYELYIIVYVPCQTSYQKKAIQIGKDQWGPGAIHGAQDDPSKLGEGVVSSAQTICLSFLGLP